jgi:hypothetical protein
MDIDRIGDKGKGKGDGKGKGKGKSEPKGGKKGDKGKGKNNSKDGKGKDDASVGELDMKFRTAGSTPREREKASKRREEKESMLLQMTMPQSSLRAVPRPKLELAKRAR